MNTRTLMRVGVYVLLGAICGYTIYAAPAYFQNKNESAASAQLRVGGSSVVYFIMDKWKLDYRKKNIDIHYAPTGSADGVKQVIDRHYQVGFSSSPLTADQHAQAKAKDGELVQVPVVLIGVVPAYHLPSLLVRDKEGKLADKDGKPLEQPHLQFSADVLAKIFLGKIDKWNAPELQELNKDVKLPDLKITVVRRKDASGTTFNFASYLHSASELWRKEMGAPANEVQWPESTKAAPRNEGVAYFVKGTEGAIGYVELINAIAARIQYGSVQNKDKTAFVLAKPETMTAAAKAAQDASPNELPTDLTNQAGKDSYPICAVDWAVCYQQQPSAEYQLVADFMSFITKEGQAYSRDLQYAPLPEEFRQRAEEKLKLIKSR